MNTDLQVLSIMSVECPTSLFVSKKFLSYLLFWLSRVFVAQTDFL